MYLVAAHPVTSPLHPPPIFQIPQLMYLKRQSDSVPRETTFSGTDSAVSTARLHARERCASCQRQRQPISPSYLPIVTSLSFLMVGFLEPISETIAESCRGIIMSLQGCFLKKTHTERMTEQETRQGKHTSAERDSSSSKTKRCQGKTLISFFLFGTINNARFTVSQNSHSVFSCLAKKRREAWQCPACILCCLPLQSDTAMISVRLRFCLRAARYAGIQRWQVVIRGDSGVSHTLHTRCWRSLWTQNSGWGDDVCSV